MGPGSNSKWPAAALLCATVALCGCGDLLSTGAGPAAPSDWFTPYEKDFAGAPVGKIHVRGFKDRAGAPTHRRLEFLQEMYFPETADSWFYSGHEIATAEAGVIHVEIGDRIAIQGRRSAPLATDATAPPALLLSVRRDLTEPQVVVVLAGYQRLRSGYRLRLVLVGGQGNPTTRGGTPDVEPVGTDVPATAVVLEREVPRQHAPSHRSGTFYQMKNASWMNIGTYAITPNPVEDSFHLTSWIDLHTEDNATHAVNNDVTTFVSGGIRIRSEGLKHSFEIDGKPVDPTNYEHALWTCRVRFEPPAAR